MVYTFKQYYLTTRLTRKAAHDVYLSYTVHEPEHKVLLKIYDTECYHPDLSPEDFHYRARKFKYLSHPHIVPILDIGVEEGKPYVVSEYASAGSLHQQLKQQASEYFPLDSALSLIADVGSALSYAHQQNIVHQKVKPENVFLNAQGKALLADFSLHEIINEPVLERMLDDRVISYIAPEQLMGSASPASDQYALACLFYELITGKLPFTARDLSYLWQRSTIPSPIPPSQFVATLPKQIESTILKALSKKPEDRFADVATFLAALEEAARPAPSKSNEEEVLLSQQPFSQRRPGRALSLPQRKTMATTRFGSLIAEKGVSSDVLTSSIVSAPTAPLVPVQTPIAGPVSMPASLPVSLYVSERIETRQQPTVAESPPVSASPVSSAQPQATPVAQNFPLGKRTYVLLCAALVCIVITAFFSTSNTSIISLMNTYASVHSISQAAGQKKPSATTTPMPVHQTLPGSALTPMPTPTSLLYSSPMRSPDRGAWEVSGSATSGCIYNGGGYQIGVSTAGTFVPCYAQNLTGSNFVFQAQMTMTCASNCGVGLIFRQIYRFHVRNGSYYLKTPVKTLAAGFNSAINLSTGQSVLLKVVANGSDISLYANNTLLAHVRDSSASSGVFGLLAVDLLKPTTAVFTNIKIWQL
jgi:serine/threonine protein kinase